MRLGLPEPITAIVNNLEGIMKKLFVFLLLLSFFIFVGCGNNSESVSSNNAIKDLSNELKEKDSIISNYEAELKSLFNENSELKESIDQLKKELDTFRQTPEDNTYEIELYKSLYKDFRRFHESTLTRSIIKKDEKISINGVYLGDNFKDVAEQFGNKYMESFEVNEAGYIDNYSFIFWDYPDGTRIWFNPLSVVNISIESEKYETSFNVKVGDSAIEALEYCDNTYEKVYNRHELPSKPIPGWYYLNNNYILILYIDGANITKESVIKKIELSIDMFD